MKYKMYPILHKFILDMIFVHQYMKFGHILILQHVDLMLTKLLLQNKNKIKYQVT